MTSWLAVDIGASHIKWLRSSAHGVDDVEMPRDDEIDELDGSPPKEVTPLLDEVESLECIAYTDEVVTYGQAARHLAEQNPQWLTRSLLTLTEDELRGDNDRSTSRAPTDLCETPSNVQMDRAAREGARGDLPLARLRTHTDGRLTLDTFGGARLPSALCANWLSHALAPPKLLSDDVRISHQHKAPDGVVWLTQPGRSPLGRAYLSKCISELSVKRGAPLSAAAAVVIDHGEDGLWGILDIGASQASWSLVSAEGRRVKVEAHYGQSGVGIEGLTRSLLSGVLDRDIEGWSALDVTTRERHLADAERWSLALCRRAWPPSLIASNDHAIHAGSMGLIENINDRVIDSFLSARADHYLRLVRRGCLEWIAQSLQHLHISPEALTGVWVTGSIGVALLREIRRHLPTVKAHTITPGAPLRGAIKYAQSVERGAEILVEEVSSERITLHHGDRRGIELISPQTPLAAYRTLWVDEASEGLNLWLSASGHSPSLLATHPPFADGPRQLHLYYDGPGALSLSWGVSPLNPIERSMTDQPAPSMKEPSPIIAHLSQWEIKF